MKKDAVIWQKTVQVLSLQSAPHLGYQKAADIAKKAIKTGESVRSLILKEKLMDEDELNRILDPIHMTEPGISGKDYLIKK